MKVEVEVGVHDIRSRFTSRIKLIGDSALTNLAALSLRKDPCYRYNFYEIHN